MRACRSVGAEQRNIFLVDELSPGGCLRGRVFIGWLRGARLVSATMTRPTVGWPVVGHRLVTTGPYRLRHLLYAALLVFAFGSYGNATVALASTPRVVATGEHDRFFSPERLRGPVRDRLGSDTEVLAGAGHPTTEENPEDVMRLQR